VLVLVAGGCRDERFPTRPALADGAGLAAARRPAAAGTALDTLTSELAAVRRALTEGDVPPFACEAAALVADDLRGGAGGPAATVALSELERLCGREVPLVRAGHALARVEARRGPAAAGGRDARRDAADCAAAVALVRPLREGHAAEPAVADLLRRLESVCAER
jgi:hypothetical protein